MFLDLFLEGPSCRVIHFDGSDVGGRRRKRYADDVL